ncbi:Transmembrane protein 14C [Merluccius polli]|uniref:Transmembrane protein 14C n=1 Tax=Merluccius polli TaxID=89951 RepID=A0AA47P0A6_MERPO|nr:Transmembrane protein 14C [Merluccius polli]
MYPKMDRQVELSQERAAWALLTAERRLGARPGGAGLNYPQCTSPVHFRRGCAPTICDRRSASGASANGPEKDKPGDKQVSNMSVDWVGYGYAALVASGGVMGYVKAVCPLEDLKVSTAVLDFPPGSVPSLAAGLLFGGLAGLGAYQVSNDPTNIWVSLATSGALTGIMGKRFYGSRKFMPAGLVAGVSVLMVGKLGIALLQKPQDT